MATKRGGRARAPGEGKAKGARPEPGKQADSGQPGGGKGRTDVTGTISEKIRIDPDLTEGHPGYQESGGSEIIPNDRLAGRGRAEKE